MKISLVTLMAAMSMAAMAQATDLVPLPMQTFFIPLPEHDIMYDTFKNINTIATGNIVSTTSVAIGVAGTVIWYDHHEDGFDPNVGLPSQSSTKIWGDNNASNGCAPGVHPCTDEADYLDAGNIILLENEVDPDRNTYDEFLFDGGDRLQASKSVAVTRGEYPTTPGSLLAGAVEVLDTTKWGTYFECPIGEDWIPPGDYDTTRSPFQYTGLYVMAGFDGTSVTIDPNDGTGPQTHTLDAGQGMNMRVCVGATVSSSNYNVQVDVLAGDWCSTYEMRWYSLLPVSSWSTSYLSPVGDLASRTRAVVYNPGPGSLSLSYKEGPHEGFQYLTIPEGRLKQTNVLGDNKGTYFEASSKFIVFQVVDTVNSEEIFDWGFPVQPIDDLTPQVLIGWGYGCEGNDCDRDMSSHPYHDMSKEHYGSRSVVWVSPVSPCTFKVDFDNDGVIDSTFHSLEYESHTIADDGDNDMTGAMIYCADSNNVPVKFAAAWGQDPERSFSSDYKALDMGTSVAPYPCEVVERFACLVQDDNNNGKIDAGELCQVTTRTFNNCLNSQTEETTIEVCEDACQYSSYDLCLHVEKVAGVRGDPHFKRWDRKEFNWPGACDLMVAKTSEIEIQVRTKITNWWSSVEKAVVKVGSLKVQVGLNELFVDGVGTPDTSLPITSGDSSLSTYVDPENIKIYELKLTSKSTVLFKILDEFVNVEIHGHFMDFRHVVGLVGDFALGKPRDRNGNRLASLDGFVEEWQVDTTAGDEQLFLTQGLAVCEMPSVSAPSRRRLRADAQLSKNADRVCAGKENPEGCMSDVMMTGNLNLAKIW